MSAWINRREDTAYFPKVQKLRHQNNRMTFQHLLEEAFDGNQRLREIWNEMERENSERLWGWEGE